MALYALIFVVVETIALRWYSRVISVFCCATSLDDPTGLDLVAHVHPLTAAIGLGTPFAITYYQLKKSGSI